MTRYFAGTDGVKTVFRQTDSGKVYVRAAYWGSRGLSFSTKVGIPVINGARAFDVHEITKPEYDHLVTLKGERQDRENVRLSFRGSPDQSFVLNVDLR